jgi:hypothetical protein
MMMMFFPIITNGYPLPTIIITTTTSVDSSEKGEKKKKKKANEVGDYFKREVFLFYSCYMETT